MCALIVKIPAGAVNLWRVMLALAANATSSTLNQSPFLLKAITEAMNHFIYNMCSYIFVENTTFRWMALTL